MQAIFGNLTTSRNGNIQPAPAPVPAGSKPDPALKAGRQPSSLIPNYPATGSSAAPATSQPCYLDADDQAPALSAALQNAAGMDALMPVLEAAIDNGDSKTIARVLKSAVRNKSDMPYQVLRTAIRKTDARRVEIMIHHPSFAAILNEPEAEQSVLGYAVRSADASMLALLLARKSRTTNVANVCAQTGPRGNTLLHMAATSGDRKKLELIMDFDPRIRRKDASDSFFARLFRDDAIDARNDDGKTALALALGAGHTLLADLLLDRGALA